MLGFMLVTAFVSMWITNTATTAMMTPIMEAVLKQLDEQYFPKKKTVDNDGVEMKERRVEENDTSDTGGETGPENDVTEIRMEEMNRVNSEKIIGR